MSYPFLSPTLLPLLLDLSPYHLLFTKLLNILSKFVLIGFWKKTILSPTIYLVFGAAWVLWNACHPSLGRCTSHSVIKNLLVQLSLTSKVLSIPFIFLLLFHISLLYTSQTWFVILYSCFFLNVHSNSHPLLVLCYIELLTEAYLKEVVLALCFLMYTCLLYICLVPLLTFRFYCMRTILFYSLLTNSLICQLIF